MYSATYPASAAGVAKVKFKTGSLAEYTKGGFPLQWLNALDSEICKALKCISRIILNIVYYVVEEGSVVQ